MTKLFHYYKSLFRFTTSLMVFIFDSETTHVLKFPPDIWSSRNGSPVQFRICLIEFNWWLVSPSWFKKKEGCAVSELSWCELIGKTSLSSLFLLGLEFLEPHRFIIRTISNIVRHIFILNLWDRKFPWLILFPWPWLKKFQEPNIDLLHLQWKFSFWCHERQWWWCLRGTFVARWSTCSYFSNFYTFSSYNFGDQPYFPDYWNVFVYFDSFGSIHFLCSTCLRFRLIQRDFDRQYLSDLRRTFDNCPTIH